MVGTKCVRLTMCVMNPNHDAAACPHSTKKMFSRAPGKLFLNLSVEHITLWFLDC